MTLISHRRARSQIVRRSSPPLVLGERHHCVCPVPTSTGHLTTRNHRAWRSESISFALPLSSEPGPDLSFVRLHKGQNGESLCGRSEARPPNRGRNQECRVKAMKKTIELNEGKLIQSLSQALAHAQGKLPLKTTRVPRRLRRAASGHLLHPRRSLKAA